MEKYRNSVERINHFLGIDRRKRKVYLYISPKEFFKGEVVEIARDGKKFLTPKEIEFISKDNSMWLLHPGSHYIKCFNGSTFLLEFWFEVTDKELSVTKVNISNDAKLFGGLIPSKENIKFG